jgi:hypothetical protein
MPLLVPKRRPGSRRLVERTWFNIVVVNVKIHSPCDVAASFCSNTRIGAVGNYSWTCRSDCRISLDHATIAYGSYLHVKDINVSSNVSRLA